MSVPLRDAHDDISMDSSETAGPDTRAVKHVEDLDLLTLHAIRDDVGVLNQNQLPSAVYSPCAACLRVLHQKFRVGDRIAEKLSCCLWVVFGDVIVGYDQGLGRPSKPPNPHIS